MTFVKTRRAFLEEWGLSSLKINLGFLEGEFKPNDPDRAAAWELYIELLTRITTQYLPPDDGDEKTALSSVHAIFQLTREILRRHGTGCGEFAKLAIPRAQPDYPPVHCQMASAFTCRRF